MPPHVVPQSKCATGTTYASSHHAATQDEDDEKCIVLLCAANQGNKTSEATDHEVQEQSAQPTFNTLANAIVPLITVSQINNKQLDSFTSTPTS